MDDKKAGEIFAHVVVRATVADPRGCAGWTGERRRGDPHRDQRFGRIGRNILRALPERGSELDVDAVNDLVTPREPAQLVRHDSVLRGPSVPVEVVGDDRGVAGRRIRVLDTAPTRVDGRHVRGVARCDNEWGFSQRVVETLELPVA